MVGSGPTGIEVAGQIAVHFPHVKLYIITKAQTLMERAIPGSHDLLAEFFRHTNTEVVFGERVRSFDGNTLVLSSGSSLVRGLHVMLCVCDLVRLVCAQCVLSVCSVPIA